jgi:hypothetical protein
MHRKKKYRKKYKLIQAFITSIYGYSVKEFIKKQDWNEPLDLCCKLFSGEELSDSENDYVHRKMGHLTSFRDRRTATQYAKELVMNWIIEDHIISVIEGCGYSCGSYGSDYKREFLSDDRTITGKSDIEVEISANHRILIELVSDYNAYWERNSMDLRHDKYANIYKENGFILGIDFKNFRFCLFHISQAGKCYKREHPIWNKVVTTIGLESVQFVGMEKFRVAVKNLLDRLVLKSTKK